MLLLIAAAPVVAGAIAPPLGTIIRQTSEQVRDDGHGARTFRIGREFVFSEEADGFRATVTLTSADAVADAGERRRYRDANAPLIGRPIVIHLDRMGAVRSVDDLDTVSGDWARGLASVIPVGKSAQTDALRTRLYTLPAERRRAMIGSIAGALFATPAERRAAAAEPVTLSSPPPFADIAMAGATTAVSESGKVRVRTVASGHAAATATAPGASVGVTIDRLVDPESGLIMDWTRRETLDGRGAKLTIETRTKLSW